MAANFIAKATKNKGALHRALNVPQGQKIPKSKEAAAKKRAKRTGNSKLFKEVTLAETLSHLRK